MVFMLVLAIRPSIAPAAAAAAPEESRYITEYNVPTPNSGPIGITVDSNGMIWFAETNVSRIARFSPDNRTFKEYALPLTDALRKNGAQIWGMVFDAKGRLWFTEATEAAIWMFDSSTEKFEKFPLQPNVFPSQIAVDSSGVLWFTELFGNQIGRLDPSKAVNNTREGITEYLIPTPDAGAISLIFDKTGKIWFTEPFSRKVGMFDPQTIRFKEYVMPESVFTLTGLAMDTAGHLWITDHGSSEFYRFDPNTGIFNEYSTSLPKYLFNVSLPYYLASDSNGKIWMNEHYSNAIAMINPETEVLTEYSIPTRNPRFGYIADALKLTVDKNDNVWFTEWTANKIAVLDSHKQVPFNIELSERDISMARGDEKEISVSLLSSNETLDAPVMLYASGTTTGTGVINGLSVSFEPAELSSAQQRNSTMTLKVKSSLPPGIYTLMVGGRYGEVNRLAAVHLVVTSPNTISSSSNTISYFLETWGVIILALTPLMAVAVLILYRRIKRRRSSD
jgi:virginiamycin B lyase